MVRLFALFHTRSRPYHTQDEHLFKVMELYRKVVSEQSSSISSLNVEESQWKIFLSCFSSLYSLLLQTGYFTLLFSRYTVIVSLFTIEILALYTVGLYTIRHGGRLFSFCVPGNGCSGTQTISSGVGLRKLIVIFTPSGVGVRKICTYLVIYSNMFLKTMLVGCQEI